MRTSLSLSLPIAATFSLTGDAFARPASQSSSGQDGVQVITVTARKYEFDPSPIRVKQGAHVQLKITATDHAHGFAIREFPQGAEKGGKPGLAFSTPPSCQKIEQGQTATVESVAQTPGTYPFHCCVHCSWHHLSMKGELIVEP